MPRSLHYYSFQAIIQEAQPKKGFGLVMATSQLDAAERVVRYYRVLYDNPDINLDVNVGVCITPETKPGYYEDLQP